MAESGQALERSEGALQRSTVALKMAQAKLASELEGAKASGAGDLLKRVRGGGGGGGDRTAARLWHARGTPMARLWHARGTPMARLRHARGTPMARLRHARRPWRPRYRDSAAEATPLAPLPHSHHRQRHPTPLPQGQRSL